MENRRSSTGAGSGKTTKPFNPLDEDCDRPACDDITSMFKAASAEETKKQKKEKERKPLPGDASTAVECPPSSAELGTGTWQLLHSMVRYDETRESGRSSANLSLSVFAFDLLGLTSACFFALSFCFQAAWYPDEPSDTDRTSMNQFFLSFARFYPCPWCATDFQANIQSKPVK